EHDTCPKRDVDGSKRLFHAAVVVHLCFLQLDHVSLASTFFFRGALVVLVRGVVAFLRGFATFALGSASAFASAFAGAFGAAGSSAFFFRPRVAGFFAGSAFL